MKNFDRGEHMSEDNQLMYEIFSDFIVQFKKTRGHVSTQELLERCSQSNVQFEDLIFAFSKLIALRYNWYSRNKSDGSGKVKDISFENDSVTITSWDNVRFEYSYQNGYRWRTQEGWISRNRIEDYLRVWPGYIDAIEDLFMPVREKLDELEMQRKINEERYHEDIKKTYDFLVEKFTLDRHPALRIWRNRNPINTEEVPENLKSIRHVKRLEITEPSFVYVWYLEVDRPSVSQVEAEFISRFQPKYNRTHIRKK
ncbi:hypothetical protein H7B90_12660 [Cohnella xylanilytica]|uniref:Uncharacterized protein n=1 Tax=Cohnella xylanilytica TaxID=557555 RepID=A0A841TVP7_9BACL|nr:hypothetical protein [Cohnella xylanilytica]MBB6692255.1 hypothetical protein [Cohnella xylanilytica]